MKSRIVRLDDGQRYYSNSTGVLFSDDECKIAVKKRLPNGDYENIEPDIKVFPENESNDEPEEEELKISKFHFSKNKKN
jgi:hypothetical protein